MSVFCPITHPSLPITQRPTGRIPDCCIGATNEVDIRLKKHIFVELGDAASSYFT